MGYSRYTGALLAIVAAWSLHSLVLSAQQTSPYVLKTGDTMVGTLTLKGPNGPVTIPVSAQPAFPSAGTIYNDATSGLMIWTGSAWVAISGGGGITGISVLQDGALRGTATALNFTHGLSAATAGVTGTISPTFGTTVDTVMQGNQAVGGDVTGSVPACYLDPAQDTLAAGDIIYCTAISPHPAWHVLHVGLDGKILTLASGLPSWAPNSTKKAPSYANLKVTRSATQTATISASELDTVGSAGETLLLQSFSDSVNLAVNGAGGLDSGSVASDNRYALFEFEKSDASAHMAIASLSATVSLVTLPAGWSGAYGRRVSWAFTNHTNKQIIDFQQQGNTQMFRNDPASLLTADGNCVLSAGTSTTYAVVNLGNRVPITSTLALIQVEANPSSSVTQAGFKIRPQGSSMDDSWACFIAAGSAQWDIYGHLYAPLSELQSLEYKNTTSAINQRAFIFVEGYIDNL